jgi:uncharacterized protein (TIGR03382 family)
MNIKNTVLAAAVACAAGLTGWAGSASAAVACDLNGSGFTAADTDDVHVRLRAADSCEYFPGNESESALNAGTGFAGITAWDRQWKSDDGDAGASGPLQLSISNFTGGGTSTGTFQLNWTGGPAVADFAITVKSSNEFFAYFFNDFLFAPASGNASSDWTVSISNRNNVFQNISHIALYTADAREYVCAPTDPQCATPRCTDPQCSPSVPLPGTLALLGVGALVLGRRRRRQ